jgi:integrase
MKVQGNGTLIALDKSRNCRDWKLQVSLGYDSLSGRYRKTSRTVHDVTKTEAKEELRKFIRELQTQSTLDANTVTVGEYAAAWLEERRNAAQPPRAGTLRNNSVAVRTIQGTLGSVLLKDLNAQQAAAFYAGLMSGGATLSGKPMSGTSARKIATTLQQMLSKAVRRRLIPSNPCDLLERENKPQVDTREKEPLSDEDVARLVACLYDGEPDAHRMGATLCLELGLRREEALGLSWGDIDLLGGEIHVHGAYTQDELAIMKPKSVKGDRRMPIAGSPLQARLIQWARAQRVHLSKLELAQNALTPVITSTTGGRVQPNNFSRWWSSYCRRIGIRTCGLHTLRHSFASSLARRGANVKDIQDLLGDATGDVALNVYMHANEDSKRHAMSEISDLFHGGLPVTGAELPEHGAA